MSSAPLNWLSKIGGDALNTTAQTICAAINELKTNFQAGVDSIYNAIVAQGTTPASKSLSDVTTAIGTMSTNRYNSGVSATKKGTAGTAQVLTGYTFTNASSVNASGTMANKSNTYQDCGTIDKSSDNYLRMYIPVAGYYDTNARIGRPMSDIGTCTAAQVLSGCTFTSSAGVKVSGTVTNNGSQSTWNPSSSTSKTYAAGYYPSSWTVNTSNAYAAGKTAGTNYTGATATNASGSKSSGGTTYPSITVSSSYAGKYGIFVFSADPYYIKDSSTPSLSIDSTSGFSSYKCLYSTSGTKVYAGLLQSGTLSVTGGATMSGSMYATLLVVS